MNQCTSQEFGFKIFKLRSQRFIPTWIYDDSCRVLDLVSVDIDVTMSVDVVVIVEVVMMVYLSLSCAFSFRLAGLFELTESTRQEGNALFGFQDLCLRQELLEYMGVHDNDASESSQPSWGKISKLEYKFQDKENSEDIFSFGSALEDFISVVFVHDRNIILTQIEVSSRMMCLTDLTLSILSAGYHQLPFDTASECQTICDMRWCLFLLIA
ncbi:hypothetical protein Tco_0531403 [Tanacetum coccineum]